MSRLWIAALSLGVVACGPSVDRDDDDGASEPLQSAVWSIGPATTRGPMTAVCIPMLDEGTCLRLLFVRDYPDPNGPSHIGGTVVGPDCAPDPDAETTVLDFNGSAYAGHGVLWVEGTTDLDDGTEVDLDIEAHLGECEI